MIYKKKILFTITISFIFAITFICASKSFHKIKTGLTRQTFIRNKNNKINYFLYLPKYYYKKNRQWPLIIYLHSMHGKGNDLGLFRWTTFPVRLDKEKDFPFIVVAPQYHLNEDYKINYSFLDNSFMQKITNKYKINRKKVYLTGVSYGGYLVWQYGIKLNSWFTALAPIAGFGVFKEVGDTTPRIPKNIEKLCNMPVWVFHGEKDKVVSRTHPDIIVNRLKKCNKQLKYTVYPDKPHYMWEDIFEKNFLFNWFLEHSKN